MHNSKFNESEVFEEGQGVYTITDDKNTDDEGPVAHDINQKLQYALGPGMGHDGRPWIKDHTDMNEDDHVDVWCIPDIGRREG